jgi:hypothetical protein
MLQDIFCQNDYEYELLLRMSLAMFLTVLYTISAVGGPWLEYSQRVVASLRSLQDTAATLSQNVIV